MKEWQKLTDEELAALTDETIELYKKIICAEKGIKFPIKPKEVEKVNPTKDLTIYRITNMSSDWSDGVVFTSLEEAQKVANILNDCKSLGHKKCEYGERYFVIGCPKDYNGDTTDFSIITEKIYSEKAYLEYKDVLRTYKDKLEQYKEDEKHYYRQLGEAESATEDFVKAVDNAKEKRRYHISLAELFCNEYLPLAGYTSNEGTTGEGTEQEKEDKNVEIAMNFLKKVYNVTGEAEDFIRNFCKNIIVDNKSV